VKPPLLGHHRRPFLLELLHKQAQDLHNVVSIDRDAPGDDVRVHQALLLKNARIICLVRLACILPLLGLVSPWRSTVWTVF
jgi:hypothetical protein